MNINGDKVDEDIRKQKPNRNTEIDTCTLYRRSILTKETKKTPNENDYSRPQEKPNSQTSNSDVGKSLDLRNKFKLAAKTIQKDVRRENIKKTALQEITGISVKDISKRFSNNNIIDPVEDELRRKMLRNMYRVGSGAREQYVNSCQHVNVDSKNDYNIDVTLDERKLFLGCVDEKGLKPLVKVKKNTDDQIRFDDLKDVGSINANSTTYASNSQLILEDDETHSIEQYSDDKKNIVSTSKINNNKNSTFEKDESYNGNSHSNGNLNESLFGNENILFELNQDDTPIKEDNDFDENRHNTTLQNINKDNDELAPEDRKIYLRKNALNCDIDAIRPNTQLFEINGFKQNEIMQLELEVYEIDNSSVLLAEGKHDIYESDHSTFLQKFKEKQEKNEKSRQSNDYGSAAESDSISSDSNERIDTIKVKSAEISHEIDDFVCSAKTEQILLSYSLEHSDSQHDEQDSKLLGPTVIESKDLSPSFSVNSGVDFDIIMNSRHNSSNNDLSVDDKGTHRASDTNIVMLQDLPPFLSDSGGENSTNGMDCSWKENNSNEESISDGQESKSDSFSFGSEIGSVGPKLEMIELLTYPNSNDEEIREKGCNMSLMQSSSKNITKEIKSKVSSDQIEKNTSITPMTSSIRSAPPRFTCAFCRVIFPKFVGLQSTPYYS